MDAPALPAPADTPELRDDQGKVFRPGFHRVNPDGSPFKGKRGQFMPRGGRIKGVPNSPKVETVSAPAPAPAGAVSPSPAEPAAPKADFTDVAKIVAQAEKEAPKPSESAPVEVVGQVSLESSWDAALRGSYAIGGGVFRARSEWDPEKGEHEQLRDLWAATARAYGWKPFPPIIPAIFASIASLWRRLTAPNTAKRLAGWFPSLGPFLGVEPAAKVEEKKPSPQPAEKPVETTTAAPRSGRAEDFFGGSNS